MLLTQGKSYIRILWVFFAAMVVLAFGLAAIRASIMLAAPLMPLLMLFVVVSEIRSRVALNSLWVATYTADCPTYRVLLAWHILGLVALTGLAILVWLTV